MTSKIHLVRYFIMLFCTVCFSTQLLAADIYLEGISVLGKKKTAHLVVDGAQMSAREGEYVGDWQIVEIASRAVTLQSDEGTSVLPLHSRLDPNQEPVAEPPTAVNPPPTPAQQLRVIDDADVPEGYRKVRTPFGDLLVKNKDAETTDAEADANDAKRQQGVDAFVNLLKSQGKNNEATAEPSTVEPPVATPE